MENDKKEIKQKSDKLATVDEKIIDLSGKFRCLKPCYIFKYKVEKGKGARHNPFHWTINTHGYPFINVVIQFRGKPGKYFQVQIRHHHPGASIGPTCTFVTNSDSGTLGPTGFELATFNGVRSMMPEIDIIAFSDDEENFEVVAATIYATVA